MILKFGLRLEINLNDTECREIRSYRIEMLKKERRKCDDDFRSWIVIRIGIAEEALNSDENEFRLFSWVGNFYSYHPETLFVGSELSSDYYYYNNIIYLIKRNLTIYIYLKKKTLLLIKLNSFF